MDELFKEIVGNVEDVREDDRGLRIEVRKASCYMPITQEQIDYQRELEESIRAFNALPPEEQARIRAENEERAAREKAERTCPLCGCDPDEHGDR